MRLGLAALLALFPIAAQATTADDLCAPDADPCVVSTSVSVTPDSNIDVGQRHLVVANRGILAVGSGAITIQAAELTVEAGGQMTARGSSVVKGGTITAEAGAITINGKIDASGAPGGSVKLVSNGQLTVAQDIDADSRSAAHDGGLIDLQGADIVVTAASSLTATGGTGGLGGDITVEATGGVVIDGLAYAAGGEGGLVDISAGGDVNLGALGTALIAANGLAQGGSGGQVIVSADDRLTMNGTLQATGHSGTVETGGGNGGSIVVLAESLTTTRTAATMTVAAGAPDGSGGIIQINAAFGPVEYAGKLIATGTGVDGAGGTILIEAADSVTLAGPISGNGGLGGGASVIVKSEAALTVPSTAAITVTSTGPGGTISLTAATQMSVQGDLTGNGDPGGANDLAACTVDIGAASVLKVQGVSGSNTLTGRDRTIVAGKLLADPVTGTNKIRYAGAPYAPQILPGAQFTPPAVLSEEDSIVPCNPVSTPTPTPTEPPCVGDCGGDGKVSIADLIVGVNIALGSKPISDCPAFDANGDGKVAINELIRAVNNALAGC